MREWWAAHKEADRRAQKAGRRRRAAEEAKQHKAELKNRAMNKIADVLSKEELEALDLNNEAK